MPVRPEFVVIVAFGLLFVFTKALANGFSLTPASIWGPLKAHPQLSMLAIIGNFLIVPALVIGSFLAVDLGARPGARERSNA